MKKPNYLGDLIRWKHCKERLFPGKGDLLDCGYGQGEYKELVESKGYSWTGIDIHPHIFPGALKQNITKIEFEDKSFEGILNIDVIEHVEDDKTAVNEMHRVLKDDGFLILHTPNKNQKHLLVTPEHQHDHVREGYSKEELFQLLKNFKNVEVIPTFNFKEALAWDINYLMMRGQGIDISKLINVLIDPTISFAFEHYGWLCVCKK